MKLEDLLHRLKELDEEHGDMDVLVTEWGKMRDIRAIVAEPFEPGDQEVSCLIVLE